MPVEPVTHEDFLKEMQGIGHYVRKSDGQRVFRNIRLRKPSQS